MKKKLSFSKIIATFFGVGLIPFAPGTFGSIMAFPLYILLTYIISMAKNGVSSISSTELVNNLFVVTVALFFLGLWAADEYSREIGVEDPGQIVIDEVVGQLFAICLVVLLLPYIGGEAIMKFKMHGIDEFCLAMLNMGGIFLLFRLFDITKPWPIDYLEKRYKGGFGIMIDDIAAAIFAVIIQFFILYAIIERL
jgi:phosphatidylglycerophosphatase A